MGSLSVVRVIEVGATPELVADRVRMFARHQDFDKVEDTGTALVFKRGGGLADFISFDVQHVSTRLIVDIETTGGITRATATMKASVTWMIFTGGDRRAFEKNLDALAETLRGGNRSS